MQRTKQIVSIHFLGRSPGMLRSPALAEARRGATKLVGRNSVWCARCVCKLWLMGYVGSLLSTQAVTPQSRE